MKEMQVTKKHVIGYSSPGLSEMSFWILRSWQNIRETTEEVNSYYLLSLSSIAQLKKYNLYTIQ